MFAVVGTALGVPREEIFSWLRSEGLRTSTQAFIAQASLIDEDRLWKQAELYLEDHWKARDAQLHKGSMPFGIDIEIVQERHHAINWVTGYDGLPWDEVTTDT